MMTVEKRYELSCYEDLKKLKENKEIFLVRHNSSGVMGVKKYLNWYNEAVYQTMSNQMFPGVPRILFCEKEEEQLVVVEEYIEGITIEQMLEDVEKIKVNSALDIILHLCEILEPLHQSQPPIIHRDIKPSNIMITKDYRLCLIDFNAAKQMSQSKEDTVLLGTKEYAAPEQYGFGSSDVRTDIYALGILLNVMITGEYPKNEKVDGKLGEIIAKATALNPDDRYESVVAFAKDLVAYENFLARKSDLNGVAQKSDFSYRLIHEKKSNNKSNNKSNKKSSEKSNKKSNEKSNKNIVTKSVLQERTDLKDWHQWLPVGFRTQVKWKMIFATIIYVLIFSLAFSTNYKDQAGELEAGSQKFVDQIFSVIVFLIPIFFYGNYGNIRYRLPLMRENKWLHWILSVGYLIMFEFIYTAFWTLVVLSLFS